MSDMRRFLNKMLLGGGLCFVLAACSSAHPEIGKEKIATSVRLEAVESVDTAPVIAPKSGATVRKLKRAVEEDGFEMASAATSDATLATMRGGFISVGGLKIDFGFNSSTAVNGATITSINLSSADLNGRIPDSVRQLLQNGSGNQSQVTGSATPVTFFTTVQNTLNGQTIQNQNTLDITVSNLAAFKNMQLGFLSRFGAGVAR